MKIEDVGGSLGISFFSNSGGDVCYIIIWMIITLGKEMTPLRDFQTRNFTNA